MEWPGFHKRLSLWTILSSDANTPSALHPLSLQSEQTLYSWISGLSSLTKHFLPPIALSRSPRTPTRNAPLGDLQIKTRFSSTLGLFPSTLFASFVAVYCFFIWFSLRDLSLVFPSIPPPPRFWHPLSFQRTSFSVFLPNEINQLAKVVQIFILTPPHDRWRGKGCGVCRWKYHLYIFSAAFRGNLCTLWSK